MLGTGSHTQLRKQPASTSSPSAAPPSRHCHPDTPPLAGMPASFSFVPAPATCLHKLLFIHTGPGHLAASRDTHGHGATVPCPASNTLPRAACCCLRWRAHIWTDSFQHSWASGSCMCKPPGFASCTSEFMDRRKPHVLPSDLGRPPIARCCVISGDPLSLSEHQTLRCRIETIIPEGEHM